jgi:quercetin dioxygenase-like cupin family protein
MAGYALAPGAGDAFGFHGASVLIKASGAQTAGQLAVMESVYPPGLAVSEHLHAGEDEMFYLLAGELAGFCAGDRWTARAGSFVFVPRDSSHGFVVTSTEPARALVITGPPQLDRQIIERGEFPSAEVSW